MNRRRLLRVGALAVAGLAGCSGDGDGSTGDTTEAYGDWFSNVKNFEDTVDRTAEEEVDVVVGAEGNGGAFAFDPAAVKVSRGTTVVWEWTGKGSSHNVLAEDGTFASSLTAEEGHIFEYTFEETGLYRYYCKPHRSLGMKGAVRVVE